MTTMGTTTTEPLPAITEPLAPVEQAEQRSERAPRPRMGLRGRILARFVVALALATLASILFQRQMLLTQLEERIDADLNQEVTELRRLVGGRDETGRCVGGTDDAGRCEIGRNPETGEPFGNDVAAVFDTFLRRNIPSDYETMLTFIDGQPYKVPAIRPAFAGDADGPLYAFADVEQPTRGDLETSSGRVRYLAVPVAAADGPTRGVFVVAQFVDLQTAQTEETLRVAVLLELALLLVASLLAYYAAGRVLKPVRDVRETARQISETDLSRRIDVAGDDEIAELARTFNAMLDRLQASFVTQRNFVDDAGHELRTPITVIRGHLELLDADDAHERRETVSIVTDELDRMTRMVDDLLVLARAERPDFLNLESVDVTSLTEDVFAKAAMLAPRSWRKEHVGRGLIVADRQRLTQAMMQLAQNATQHTAEHDTITIGSAVGDGEARFWVRDTGPGIARADQARIFERFSRGAATRRTQGAGLGLSIVSAIAQAHSGRIELVSSPNAGATFTLVVPIDPPADTAEAAT